MDTLIRKMLHVEFKEKADDPSVMTGFVGSTIDEDRDDDILDPKGADLSDYTRNPVFLADHTYSVHSIVGKTFDHKVTDKGIEFSVQFDMDDPAAARVAHKFRKGFAKAISVGFRGTEATLRKNLDEGHFAYKAESHGLYFSKWAVREFSAVAVPANPNALVEARAAKGLVGDGDGVKAAVLDLIAKDADIRSAVRGLLMGAAAHSDEDGSSGSGAAVPPSLATWLSSQ